MGLEARGISVPGSRRLSNGLDCWSDNLRDTLRGRVTAFTSCAIAVPLCLAAVVFAGAQDSSQRVVITFAAQQKSATFEAAAVEYRRIWAAEGNHIIEGLERITGLTFPEKSLTVEIYEGPSFSGLGKDPMRLRASYTPDNKKGALVHELGHRMNAQIGKRPSDPDEHRLLFLYLYDLYVDLYGKDFADRQVAFSRSLKGLYNYDAAWNWALAMTRDQRRARFAEVVKIRVKVPE